MGRNLRAVAHYKARLLERVQNLDPNLANGLRSMQLDWYRIKNQLEEEAEDELPTEVFIYDEIGGSFGVSADQFVKDLQDVTSKQIHVRINSPGGSVFDSIAIYNALVKHPAYVTTYVDALAASAASVIAMAGDEVVMMVGSQMMIHDALGVEIGNAKVMREMANFLDRQSDNIASIYANKAGGEIEEWRGRMLDETWLFAGEAVDLGLADMVYKPPSRAEIGEVPEEEPDEDQDDEDADVPTEDDESDEDSEELVTALMHQRHRLTNRGFKYIGRNSAPDPLDAHPVKARRKRPQVPSIVDDKMIQNYLAKLGG